MAALWLCSGCSAQLDERDVATLPAPSPVVNPTPVFEHVSIDPMALGDAELVAAIDRHTWLVHFGRAWVGTESPFDEHEDHTPDDHVLC